MHFEIEDTSYIEISKGALENNIAFIRSLIGNEVELVSVIKGNAYGHGIDDFAPLAIANAVRSFAVFSAFEAEILLQAGVTCDRIIIMGSVDGQQLYWAIQNQVEFFVFEMERLQKSLEAAKSLHMKAKIHLEIETGLNRTGFIKSELNKAVKLVQENPDYLHVEGFCSHLSGAENISNYLRIKKQISNFNRITKWGENELGPLHFNHLACSAAIVNYPKTIHKMVRIGIMQYGLWPSKEVRMAYLSKTKDKVDPLKRLLSWKSMVMSIKKVKAGEFIGYGNHAMAETNMVIATVPVGYSHGFSRSLSNQGKVLIAGVRLNVMGVVNMNMMIVDITHVANEVKKGDEVVLIGQQGDLEISIASFSDLSDQLNYELLTRLPNDIPRKIVA